MEAEAGAGALKMRKESEGGGGVILKLKKEALEALELMPPHHTKKPTATDQEKKRRKTKVVKERLPLGLIELMIASPYKPVDEIPQERLAELPQDYVEGYTIRKFIADKVLAYEQALVQQYLTKGYAEDESEVTDDEDE